MQIKRADANIEMMTLQPLEREFRVLYGTYKPVDDLSTRLDGLLDGSGREVSIYVAVRIR